MAILSRFEGLLDIAPFQWSLPVILIVVLIGFSYFIYRTKQVRDKLRRQLTVSELLRRTSTRFGEEPSVHLSNQIDEMLHDITQTLDLGACLLFQIDHRQRWQLTHGRSHQMAMSGITIDLKDPAWFETQFLNEGYLHIRDREILVGKIDDMALGYMARAKLQSILLVPMIIEESIQGALAFASQKTKPWNKQEIRLLTVLANILSDAIDKADIEFRLREERERLRITIQSLGDAFIATNAYGQITMLNKQAETLIGLSEKEALNHRLRDIFVVRNKDGRLLDPVQDVLRDGRSLQLSDDLTLLAADGTQIPISDSIAPIRNESGQIQGAVLIFRDVTLEKEKQEHILYLSFHDQLTGLYNRRFFEEELRRLDTPRNLPFAVIMADINGLKLANDAFGHSMGDELLKATANSLKNACRADDIIARLGGDEFAILLPKTDSQEAAEVVRRIHQNTESLTIEPLVISLAIGWDVKARSDVNIRETLARAEENMYRQKLTQGHQIRRSIVDSIIQSRMESEMDRNHTQRVRFYALELGRILGLSDGHLDTLATAALLHDIGQVGIDPGLLRKPSPLTPQEFEEIRRHPAIGYRILNSVPELSDIADIVLKHHEHWDGSGYPLGLKGSDIPLESRILTIADAYTSMTEKRPFRPARPPHAAREEILQYAGRQFDPHLAHRFVEEVLDGNHENEQQAKNR